MDVEGNLKNKYKVFLKSVKYLPYLIAILDMVNTFASFVEVDLVFLTYLSGVGILPLIFMILVSLTFKFCTYHRIPIYYILVNNLIMTYDWYFTIPLLESLLLGVYLVVAVIFILVFTALHLKEKNENNRINKRITTT